MTESKVRVLFVCMGNICRSPTAEGVFRKLVSDAGLAEHVHIESAGTHAYHVGEPPDRRAQAAAERRGVTLADIRARRVSEQDFDLFDLILAMDRDNLEALLAQAGEERRRADVRLFLEYSAAAREQDVPDPYYGGAAGFERVLDLVEEAAAGLLRELRQSRL
ncbi:MAG: low molecular weight phosphotyrosine protein phosphatase [Gammaproteobacteria bacterium]|nr:low molecular weight phosphotyrosine protein phosphatase [Gammaproteobacteria bacterium]MDH4255494.1 low molecular weight phosphotyrosine protein phosphatase [Gammaproteobacteria bacterium]MDH5311158.1 low molecular weight phosphotyrosine protein phosphatase [Gammaproteobacteria bacterium]